eukprot:TRINITY_DN73119_c0_g1_i1.p1 TRINITY_DN73119_c0_g1~~TRINITY_DN73119_c0_g1_i1.p1  ORF type:complete len:365 (+),score=120.54 TRINITY_DN73119_c0_g1_i1:41-1096(+)
MALVRLGSFEHAVLSITFIFGVVYYYGLVIAVLLGTCLNMFGVISFFPALYRLYTSNLLGYHVLRLVMHPRQPKPHSTCSLWSGQVEGVSVQPIPVLVDNYAYLVWCTETHEAAVVDPADPDAVYNAVLAHDPPLNLTTIIATHKHWDHSGGNRELVDLFRERHGGKELRVVGSSIDMPHSMTHAVGDGDTVALGSLTMRFRMVPGHTKGHVLTLVEGGGGSDGLLAFTGDSLFCCGVGAFFEADDVEELHHTHGVYHSLPGSCWVFPGHEYSHMLAHQACSADPSNHMAAVCRQQFSLARRSNVATVPSTMTVEKQANPFLRIPRNTMLQLRTSDQVQQAMYTRQRSHAD